MRLRIFLFVCSTILATMLVLMFLFLPKNYLNAGFSIPGLSFPVIPGSGDIPLGGKIERSSRCDLFCTEEFQGHLIHVGDPKGGDFVNDFSSKVYRENSFSKGNYVVGLATNQERTCKGVTKKKAAEAIIRCIFGDCNPKNACEDLGTGKVIKIIGTSK